MSSSESKAHTSPLLVKAGIPAALSVAAYICVKMVSKCSNFSTPSPSCLDQNCCSDSPNNPSSYDQYDEENNAGSQIIGINSGNLEDKLLELEIHMEDLQRKKRDLMSQYYRYRVMKEKEFMLMEIKYKMMLEKTRAEFLLKEVSLVQEESKRMGGLILEYVKLVNLLEDSKKEKRLLQKKAWNLCKRARQRLKIIMEQKLRIEAREEEVLSNYEEIQRKDDRIQELEDEVCQMKEIIAHLQREKIEISNKLDFPENSYTLDDPKIEIEYGVTKEEHEKVVKEVEQLQKDREAEANELTYLKWTNACLRHELMRCHELNIEENGNKAEEFESLEDHQHGHEADDNTVIHSVDDEHESSLAMTNGSNPSRRRKFIQKVKKWVEGGKIMDEKEKDETKSFGNINKHSVSKEAHDTLFVHGRMSCSSV